MLVRKPSIGPLASRIPSLLALLAPSLLTGACDQNLTAGALPQTVDLAMPYAAPLDLLPPGFCSTDEACGPGAPRCDTGTHRCVACLPQNDNCAGGQRCLLRSGVYTCTFGCDVDSDCARPDAGGPMVACCGGTCIDLSADTANCGSCGHGCGAVASGSAACQGGLCVIAACDTGRLDCDHRTDNGCEVISTSDDANCGACGSACSRDNADAHCVAAACTLASCHDGFADCDGNDDNGCEVGTDTDAGNCGACGHACAGAGSVQSCSHGACHVDSCTKGLADCDGVAGNGCEVDVQNDARNCGTCGKACWFANGAGVCAAGVCTLKTCNVGFADCNGLPQDGCEADLGSPKSCGACGKVCSGPANVAVACTGGACMVGGCLPGFMDCDGNPNNGCEPKPCAQCVNGKKDGDESDVDCGGSLCAACKAGQGCAVNADCESQSCNAVCCQQGFVCDQNGCHAVCQVACNVCNP